MPQNQIAWLDEPGKPLRIDNAEMPQPGPDEVVIKNRAVGINPIDTKMANFGLLLKKYPAVFGQDIAGEVFGVGSNVSKFKKGDRVIAQAWIFDPEHCDPATFDFLKSGDDEAAFAVYTKVKAGAVAALPSNVAFAEGAVLPTGLSTAIAGLYKAEPFLNLPKPTPNPKASGSVLLVYGGSSCVGLCAIQLAVASGLRVLTIASSRNHALCKSVGASLVFDQTDAELVDKVVEAVGGDTFAGIYDAISMPSTYSHDLEILAKLGGGRVASTLPIPEDISHRADGKVNVVFPLGDFVFPIWEKFVGPALESDKLKCLPEPLVVGKGLESIGRALERCAQGVSAQKVVFELDA